MPQQLVNLDALIKRQDFEGADSDVAGLMPAQPVQIRIADLVPGTITYNALRKPDFQRETAAWSPQKVAELIEGFVRGDLVPSVILWQSEKSGNIFVIDGAHRLSALIAWVTNDFGDRAVSRAFFGEDIPPEQEAAAKKTRQLVEATIGSYEELRNASQDEARYPAEKVVLAKRLAFGPIALQTVPGDATNAERSYFKINQQAAPIDETERRMINARKKANGIATRALLRAGTAYKWWFSFPNTNQDAIERIAKEVHESLFKPALEEPIRTLALPVAGRIYTADTISMLFDVVNFVNNVPPYEFTEEKPLAAKGKTEPLPDDADGSQTVKFLTAVQGISWRISGKRPESLGLHPGVYFYGNTGRFHSSAFVATVVFVSRLVEKDQLVAFTGVRKQFEEFLLRYRHFPNQIVSALGGGSRRARAFLSLFTILLRELLLKSQDEEIIRRLKEEPNLSYLQPAPEPLRKQTGRISTETKNAVYFREAMPKELTCAICGARLHFKSISYDHKKRERDGGLGSEDNQQLTHFYCNTGYKESLHARGIEV